ncbi:hypothetical protein HG535_0G04510 [Zygotorulaspora mrakii]|uniref:Trafficking protein particle complex III-specific subunit 85 n=1 Tax=Zygotorulaspora mrakii TaxID=42260 RepID=A0A7H9B757_ZYGMR|nr:uncharacterized protein HG535_0G04510 [Zygotorulaspora mrakii]QLG74568.1 hypothetical protein HG535_0G04510 [Zygotorulaspora mrakii]
MGKLSYEGYMNLLFHPEYDEETIPSDIAKRIISNAISPVISVTSTPELDEHIQQAYGIDSLYMLLRFFGNCVTDRDQTNEYSFGEAPENKPSDGSSSTGTSPADSNLRSRKRSNTLFQRDLTQSRYIRFTRSLGDLVESGSPDDMLFDYHSLETFLQAMLRRIESQTTDKTTHTLLKKSLYHRFFSLAISSTSYLSPYEAFNHPVVSLIALDTHLGQGYDDARDLLSEFKSLSSTTEIFPVFLSTTDILPVFLLCYYADSDEEYESSKALARKLKKQLFVESILLPLWKESYQENVQVPLHQPVMTSLDEMLFMMQSPVCLKLSLELINATYDVLENLVNDLMVPFMQRKISFWDETVLQTRKSLFHGNKLFKRFMSRTAGGNNVQQQSSLVKDKEGRNYFIFSSPELLMRKLADWSMMLGEFKRAYSTYDLISHDFEGFPKYLASCLEWCAVSVLMGAQNIVTAKMLKSDIDPLIQRAVDTYEACALDQSSTNGVSGSLHDGPIVRSYETRCLFLASELYLSLSDTWTSTPYALQNLETILGECKLGPCSQIMIWERISDCYYLRIDPRIRHKVPSAAAKKSERESNGMMEIGTDGNLHEDIVTKGFTRLRKAAFFRLISATMWAEQKQWRQVAWCLKDIEGSYEGINLVNRKNLTLAKLKDELAKKENFSEGQIHEKSSVNVATKAVIE